MKIQPAKISYIGVQAIYNRRYQTISLEYLIQEGNVLFNDALNTFYLRLYGIGHMVKNNSDCERKLFSIISKGSFICIIPQTG